MPYSDPWLASHRASLGVESQEKSHLPKIPQKTVQNILAMTFPTTFLPHLLSSLHLSSFLLFPLIMSVTTLTLDSEEDTRAEKFGDFVFENGVIVRVTERDDLTGNATEIPNVDKELNIDGTVVNNDFGFVGGEDGEVSTEKREGGEETTETVSDPVPPTTYNGAGQGEDTAIVDVNVSSYHNYSALVDLFGSLERQYGHIFTRCVQLLTHFQSFA